MGSKWAHLTCLGIPNGLGSFLEKHIFDPFFCPKTAHFQGILGGILGGPKRATTSSKRAQNTCFGIPCGLGSFLKKVIFLYPVDLLDPFWHLPLRVTSCSLPRPTGPRYEGLLGAAAMRCGRGGEATTWDDGSSKVKAYPSRVALALAARVTWVCWMRRDPPSSERR